MCSIVFHFTTYYSQLKFYFENEKPYLKFGLKKCFRDIKDFKTLGQGNSLVAQWLGLSAFTFQGSGSVPGQETDIHKPCGAAKRNKQKNLCQKRSQVSVKQYLFI